MGDFEKRIILWIKKNEYFNKVTGKHEVKEDEIKKMNLTLRQRLKLEEYLNMYSIAINKDAIITEEDRSPLVKDLEYGENEELGVLKYDMPKMSEVTVTETDQVVAEDYSRLEGYLLNYVIPKNIKLRRKKQEDGEVDYYATIALNVLTKLKLSELELKHAMEFLQSKDIYVVGISSSMEEFDNYIRIKRLKEKEIEKSRLSWDEELELFKKYSELKDDPTKVDEALQVRNKIVQSNIKLVGFVNYKFAIKYNFNIEELNSYGYEALINATESFDYTKGYRFSSYAYRCIQWKVLKNIAVELGFYNIVDYSNVQKSISSINEFYEDQGIDATARREDVVDLLMAKGYSQGKSNALYDRNEFRNKEDYDNLEEEEDHEFDLDKIVDRSTIRELIMGAIETLTEREKMVIIDRFGLEDGVVKSLEEVGNKFNVTRERIRQIEAKALRKLRHPSRSEKLKELL